MALRMLGFGKHEVTGPMPCGDCGCEEGTLHEFLCLKERCPFCGGQLATCECAYEALQLADSRKWTQETDYLPPDTYDDGLNHAQLDEWRAICEDKGRFPLIRYPNMCACCGELWPELFMVSDEEWRAAVEPAVRNKILCLTCFQRIAAQVAAART